MMNLLKRVTAVLLLVALLWGTVGGVSLPKAKADDSVVNVQTEEAENLLANPGFETLKANGLPMNWSKWGNPTLSAVRESQEPDNVFEGNYALKINAKAATDITAGTAGGMESDRVPITPGTTYTATAYAKEGYTVGAGFQIYIRFSHYDAETQKYVIDASVYITTGITGQWNYYEVSAAAPAGSTHATVLLTSGAGKGDAYFDKVTLTAGGTTEVAPEEFDGNWSLMYADYPRLDFDKAGLESIKEFSQSTVISAYGYSGSGALTKLLANAEKYVAETALTLTYLGTTTIVFPLHPVLEDPTCREEFETAPGNFAPTFRYPYMTSFGSNMVTRMQTLSLAYAITGDVRYGERAKQYALDMCSWQYWVGHHETLENGDELSSQASGYILDCVMAAYDMCHDLFTAEELAKVEAQIIEKGLEAMYHDCWPRMIKGRDMDHATGLILASCLIMNENNVDQLKKYLDMGMTYVNWRLDHFLKSGVNEGNMYDSLAIDDIIVTLYTLQRVTGYEGPFNHSYMSELEKRVLGFFEMVEGTLPAYSDSQFKSTYYPYTAAYLSRNGNDLATYYLAVGGALSSAYDQLIWHTDMTLDQVKTPDERVGNVTYLGSHGQGALRTGWGTLDSLLVINANNTKQEHNHFDQNSILLAFNRNWILNDSEYKDNAYTTLTTWEQKYTNSTIFVDGQPQSQKGNSSLEQVFNTHVYGYMIGDAAGAYGMEDRQAVLNKFDRHVIMLNHDSQPYYIIIDDLESNKERNFGWNFYGNGKLGLEDDKYTNYWDQVEMDGQVVANGTSATGNRLTLFSQGVTLHSYFVGQQVTTKEVSFESHGPTLLVENTTASKNYQFMNILSVEKDTATQYTTKFADLMGIEGAISLRNEEGCSYEKTTIAGEEMVKFILEPGTKLNGPGITFKFNVPEDGEYFITVDLGQTMTTENYWNVYISGVDNDGDGKTDCLSLANTPKGPEGVYIVDCGKQYLKAGENTVYILLSGSAAEGASLAIGGINLRKAGSTMGEGSVKVLESYDQGDLLGATIGYGTTLKDIVLFNRGTGMIMGGELATNGQQASILGLNGSDISEGYAVTNGTSLKYGELTLLTAEGPVSVAVDFTMAKLPVKNGTVEPELHKDFNELDPVVYISTKADAATQASIYLGQNVNYTAYVDGVAVPSTYANGVLTITIPAGEHQITVSGEHHHDWAEADCITPATCRLCGKTTGEALGHTWVPATCTTSKFCSVCAYAEGGPKHSNDVGGTCTICSKIFGYCSDGITWDMDMSGILTISGIGAIPDYTLSDKAPWDGLSASITSVVITDGVTTIGNYAFYNMTMITDVVMGDDVTTIGNYAFRGCTGLLTLQMGKGVTDIITRAFYGCTNLTTLVMHSNVKNIGVYAFYNCKKLADVVYCGTAEQWNTISISSSGNNTLTAVTPSFHDWNAATCTAPATCKYCGLTEGDIAHTWQEATCTTPKTCIFCGLTEGEPSHNVVNEVCTGCGRYGTCGENLVWTLSADGTLTISGTGDMNDYTGGSGATPAPWFPKRNLIKSVVIEDGVTSIGRYAFVLCEKLASVQMGKDVQVVRFASFHQCKVLERIVFGPSVTTIEQQAFAAATILKYVALPESITLIDYGAFYKCTMLETVVYCGTQEQWEQIVVKSTPGGTSDNSYFLAATRTEHAWTNTGCTEPKTCTVCGKTEGVGGSHSWMEATCTTAKFCIVCGAVEGEALGHNYNAVVTEPSCEKGGYTTYTCDRCGDSYVGDRVDAKGHNYMETVTQPTCTAAGFTVFNCTVCGHFTVGNNVPALGHSNAEPVKENEINATCGAAGSYASVVYCATCGEKLSTEIITVPATGEHTWADEADTDCDVCGEKREVGPVADANLKFVQAPSLSFQDYIGMQVMIYNSLAKNYDEIYVEAVQMDPEKGAVTSKLVGFLYYYDMFLVFDQQILSWSMAEEVTLTLYGVKDGKTFVGQSYTYSVESLALAMLSSTSNTKLKTVLVDMLNYGAAVQTAYNHNKDMLPNAQIDAYAEFGTACDPELNATVTKEGTGSVYIAQVSISMQSKVEIQLLFAQNISAYTAKAMNGETALNCVVDTETMGAFGFTIVRVAIGAANMRDNITMALYDAEGNAVTTVYTVSAEAFAKSLANGTQGPVALAMMRYGDAVAAYAGK